MGGISRPELTATPSWGDSRQKRRSIRSTRPVSTCESPVQAKYCKTPLPYQAGGVPAALRPFPEVGEYTHAMGIS